MTLPDWMNDWIDAIYEHHTLSWIGHGVQGLLIGFVGAWLGLLLGGTGAAGLLLTVGAFGHREIEDVLTPLRREGWGVARSKFASDGAMDFISPYIGAVVGTAVALIVR